eukprot:TRINITY_DN4256_c3_g1_i11.p1 TRINITY_DN4256_c3_g1~~TRINITY_DN4256_c3_g1_i11.p1  ORF type:complete len:1743 (-),score=580.06 TRINITY_DN4256_c3_g1_i11:39-5267(-)
MEANQPSVSPPLQVPSNSISNQQGFAPNPLSPKLFFRERKNSETATGLPSLNPLSPSLSIREVNKTVGKSSLSARATSELNRWKEKLSNSINLEGERLGPKGIKNVFLSIEEENGNGLESINLKGNYLGKRGMEHFLDLMKACPQWKPTHLYLSDNEIDDSSLMVLIPILTRNNNLTCLDLQRNNITSDGAKSLAALLSVNSTIKQFFVSSNRLGKDGTKVISDALRSNQNILQELYIADAEMDKKGCVALGDALRGMINALSQKRLSDLSMGTGLTVLDLSGNNIGDEGITWLSDCLKNNVTITTLNLCDNGITKKGVVSIVTHLMPLQSLQNLDLSKNKLGPKSTQNISEKLRTSMLHTLSLSNCGTKTEGAESLFQALTNNKYITNLDVSKNNIGDSAGLAILSVMRRNKLKILNLSGNNLMTGLDGIGNIFKVNTSLEEFYINSNPFKTQLAQEFASAVANCTALVTFEAKNTDITQEGVALIEQSYKRNVTLRNCVVNGLQMLGKELTSMMLRTIPEEILNMEFLRYLDLSDNLLTEIPNSITQLINLRELILKNNQLQALPQALGYLKNTLKVINVEGNDLKTPPKEIVKRGVKEILGYLSDMLEGSEPCYRIKLMIVGQENVGKTTIKDTMSKNINANPGLSTDGIDIDDWSMKVAFPNKPKPQKVYVKSMDFGGQQAYYSTHQFFLSQRSIYILAFDLRYPEEESRVEFWLWTISTKSPQSPLIIVGTHADDKKCTQEYMSSVLQAMKDKYQKRFRNIVDYFALDATKNVPQLKKQIKNIIASQTTMGEAIPKAYLELERLILEERRVQSSKTPIIKWSDYTKLGTLASIHDEKTLQRATQFFHDLGVLIYFNDKRTNLSDFVILDPSFIIDLLKTIITTKSNFVKDGILLTKDLDQIWKPPLFEKQYFDTFLTLLSKFEIFHNLDGDNYMNGRLLIPALVTESEPENLETTIWPPYTVEKPKQLDRWFHLSFVPAGLLTRLLVRMFRYSEEIVSYWSNGAVMIIRQKDHAEKLLIRIIPQSKLLMISVRGATSLPMRTARLVVETVDAIVNSWYHLDMIATVPCKHCFGLKISPPHEFNVRECSFECAKGKRQLNCPNGEGILAMENLVPDIAMTDIGLDRFNYDTDLELKGSLGRGAFGEIYEAIYNGKSVAVKKMIVENQEKETLIKLFSEFRQEVWLMSTLRHPNVVNLKGYCINPYAMLMEKVDNGPLYRFLHKEGEISWDLKMRIAVDIAQGMHFLHTQTPPVLHRDLKSPNILLASLSDTAEVVAKVSDFGTSTHLFNSAIKEKSKERIVILPNWLAPEIMSQDEYTEKSDVYAYGIILWELLCRKHPFEEFTFMSELEDAIVHGKRPPIPSDVPPVYRDLMEECWRQEAPRRPTFKVVLAKLVEYVIPAIAPDAKQYIRFWTTAQSIKPGSRTSGIVMNTSAPSLPPMKMITIPVEIPSPHVTEQASPKVGSPPLPPSSSPKVGTPPLNNYIQEKGFAAPPIQIPSFPLKSNFLSTSSPILPTSTSFLDSSKSSAKLAPELIKEISTSIQSKAKPSTPAPQPTSSPVIKRVDSDDEIQMGLPLSVIQLNPPSSTSKAPTSTEPKRERSPAFFVPTKSASTPLMSRPDPIVEPIKPEPEQTTITTTPMSVPLKPTFSQSTVNSNIMKGPPSHPPPPSPKPSPPPTPPPTPPSLSPRYDEDEPQQIHNQTRSGRKLPETPPITSPKLTNTDTSPRAVVGPTLPKIDKH